MDEARVYKSNALIEASYRLSVTEQRIILACISQARRDGPITDKIFYSVSVADIAEMAGTESKSLYDELAKAAKKLKRQDVYIALEPNGGGYKPKILQTSWVQSCIYIEREGRVELRFNTDMIPYLAELEKQFTRYSLADVVKMTSSHAIRLFELLIQYENMGHREISIDDFRKWLMLEDSYPLMAELRRRVIEPAVEQINKHSSLAVTWGQRKAGRKVTHLTFDFSPQKPAKLAKAAKPKGKASGMTEAEIAALARPGETWEQVRARLNKAQSA